VLNLAENFVSYSTCVSLGTSGASCC